ncbi:MAG: A/G-specific adenine glycosylase, partial [Gemmatimonadetes bacterium]|nr:A/G-specific adenine glycosylase [Gemmatimonadota bacterium]
MTNHCPTTGLRAIADAAETRQDLLAWYDRQQRDLPWRRERDPYRVWVSEVMLQQTRVETVLPYYERWMKRFPALDDLADADPEDVLRAWSGLGYYARARNLHRAAMTVRERHGAVLPNDAARLRELPGVGAYTAGAVASIAFGRPEPAVDGNARRVLCRLFDLASPSAAELFRRAAALVDPDRPGDFNQALMELGATVCRPRAPRCARCPLARGCRARARGTAEYRPRARSGGPVPAFRVGTAVVVSSRGRFLLGRRPPRGLLGGLW